MRLTMRDGLATIVVAAAVVPYLGYAAFGEMPFINDSRAMSGIALGLGFVAFLVAGQISTAAGRLDLALGMATLGVGVAAVALADTAAAAGAVLGVFVAMIVITWAVEMLHHAGVIQDRPEPVSPRHSRWS
jgi:hypothetical protein